MGVERIDRIIFACKNFIRSSHGSIEGHILEGLALHYSLVKALR